MRTIVYVDGYNLYYSSLTKSPHKWLDLYELFATRVIKPIEPRATVEKIKFFTAPILGRFASDKESPNRQQRYHNALQAKYADRIEIICGYHLLKETTGYPVVTTGGADPINVRVLEEKQTDVNIGLHMYRDAALDLADQLVLVSNDSDIAPALEMIRADHPRLTIGVIIPALADNERARRSGQLSQLSDWTRDHLNTAELGESQLPAAIQNHKNKTIRKPDAW